MNDQLAAARSQLMQDRRDVEIVRAVAEHRHNGADPIAVDRLIALGLMTPGVAPEPALAREWLAKRDRTPTGFDPKLLTPPKPAAYKHDPQRYQTLIDRVRRDVATCAKCHRDCVPCLVLEVQRTMQADRAEVRVSFPLAWCYDCARKEVPA